MLNRPALTKTFYPTRGEHDFDLREGVGFVWRQWGFIVSIVGAVLLLAVVYEYTRTPRYTATALILLEQQRDRSIELEKQFELPLSLDAVESQIAIIKSTIFLRRVVEKLDLMSDHEFGARSMQDAVSRLLGAMYVGRVGEGFVLNISATSVDPSRAAKIANAIADGYVVEKLDARFDAAKRASAWLSDRLVELRAQLRDLEEAVAQFRSDNGLIQSGTTVTLNQQQLSELNGKLLDARADLAQKKARVDVLHSIMELGGNIQSLPDLPASPQLDELRKQEVALSQKKADFVARYDERSPVIIHVDAQIGDIKRAIQAELKRLASKVVNDYELAKARQSAVEQSVREATGQIGIDDKTAITLRELERTATVNKSLFEDFLKKAKITDEQSTFEARDARVITPAYPPAFPSYPKKLQFLAIAAVIACLLGVGAAVAKDKLNGGFATPRQVEDILQLPLLSSINLMNDRDLNIKGKKVRLQLLPAISPLSRYSESVRTLRSGIQMADVDHPPKVIQVTSTVPNEGKTTIALSLAVSAAVSGLKVLFLDADLRRHSGSNFFGLTKAQGLVDVLAGSASIEETILYNEDAKLWVIPAGGKTRTPADLLGSNRMKSFLEQCRKTFDCIIVDSPPVGPVVDAIVLSHLADFVVYVIRWASTARELVQQSIQRLEGTKVAGVVFNQVNEKAAQKYGKYAYLYYYSSRSFKKYYEE